MVKRTAIVHVGLEKTGTTSIQAWLGRQRADLLDQGILYPESPGPLNHTRLVAACMDDDAIDNIKAHQMARQAQSGAALRARFAQEFAAELAANRNWHTLVISSELITSRLHMPSEVDRLVAMLRPHVDEIRFVIFLRRQVELAVSRFSSALRAGHDRFDGMFEDLSSNAFRALPPGRSADDLVEYFDYDRILSRFERIDGATVDVVVFNPPGGRIDPVRSFAASLGLDLPEQAETDLHLNAAMSAEGQYIISQLNQRYTVQFPSGLRNAPYQALLRRIEAEVSGRKRTAPRPEAEAFQDRFTASNARVADRYGAQFRTDYDKYPDQVDYSDLATVTQGLLQAFDSMAAAMPRQEAPSARLRFGLRRAASALGLR